MPEDIVAINLRLPRELHAELRRVAGLERRSLNGQIIYLLTEGVRRYQPPTRYVIETREPEE